MSGSRAFVYDFLSARGGAENLALHVAESVPDLDLVTAYIDRGVLDEDLVAASACITLTTPTTLHGWHALKAIRAFQRCGALLEKYREVVFSGYYAPLAIAHRRGKSKPLLLPHAATLRL